VIELPDDTCYQIAGSGNQLTLSGPGFPAGSMLLRSSLVVPARGALRRRRLAAMPAASTADHAA
jgi:hypothetical protein